MQFCTSYWWVLLIVLLVIILAVATIIIIKNKKPRIKVDEAFIDRLMELLGSDNLAGVSLDNGNRLKIEVKDLDIVDLNGLKEISESGVFVTGNIIKILFKLDSVTIKQALEKRI